MITLPMSHNGHIMGWNGHWLGRTGYASYEPFTAHLQPNIEELRTSYVTTAGIMSYVTTASIMSSYLILSATGGGLKRLDKFDLWSPRLIECGFRTSWNTGYFRCSRLSTWDYTTLTVTYNGYKYGNCDIGGGYGGRYYQSGDTVETTYPSDTYTGQFAKSGITPDNCMVSRTSVYTSYANTGTAGGCWFNPAYCKSIFIDYNYYPGSHVSGVPDHRTDNNARIIVTGKIGME